MKIVFTDNAWADYTAWQKDDKKMVAKINKLILEILREPYKGSGKPEPLKFQLSGFWSRRINLEHRLVYQCTEDEVRIVACKYHY